MMGKLEGMITFEELKEWREYICSLSPTEQIALRNEMGEHYNACWFDVTIPSIYIVNIHVILDELDIQRSLHGILRDEGGHGE